MAHLTVTQRIEILILIGCGDKTRTQLQVCDLFNEKYPDRKICQSTVSKVESKFRETGNVLDIKKPGRPSVSENEKQNIMISMEDNPHNSLRFVAINSEISKSTVHRVLKKEKYHPYKIQFVQELIEDDPDRRLHFCEIMMDLCQANGDFHQKIIFSDEATFCLNGTVNRQTCRYWSRDNPHWMAEAHTQHPQKINVWAGIVHNRILGPFFFEGTLTGEKYLEFLQNDLVPALAVIFPNDIDPDIPDGTIWFQQDGAPPHYAHPVRDFLDNCFPRRWIGRRGPIEWPARSPDLTPLDFFLWGYLKSKVYLNKPHNLEDLQNRITYEIRRITPEVIQNVQEEFLHRLAYCQEVGGWHFEHLI